MRRAALFLLAGLLGACSGRGVALRGAAEHAVPVDLQASPADTAAITTLYRQALAAGQNRVVVYSTTGSAEWEPLWRRFSRTFPGLEVTYAHIAPSQVMGRIRTEEVTGRRFGDVYMLPVNIAPEIARKGFFQPYVPPTAAALPARYADGPGLVRYPFAKVFGLAYNTRQVAADALPGDLDAVLAPAWRGRFTYIKPGSVNGTPDVGIALMRDRGAATAPQLAALRRNGAYAGVEAGVTYVSQGRQQLQLWAYLPTVLRQQSLGAPVAMAFRPDFSVLVPFGVSISRDAPHVQAARLLEAWLYTPGAQAALAREAGMAPTMPGAPRPPLYPEDPAARAVIEAEPPPAVLARQVKTQLPELRRLFNAAKS